MSVIDFFRLLNHAAASPAVSRAEAEQLKSERQKPGAAYQMTPQPGGSVREVANQHREARIAHIEARLEEAHGRAVTDFALGKQRDTARRDFGRER